MEQSGSFILVILTFNILVYIDLKIFLYHNNSLDAYIL